MKRISCQKHVVVKFLPQSGREDEMIRLVNSSMQYSFVRTILPLKRMTNLREVLGLGSVFRAESRIVLSNQPAQRDPHSFPRAIDRGILRFRGRFPPPDPI